MPNGSSRVRRQLRAHFWGSTKLSRNLRGIRPVAVGVTVNGFFGTIDLDGVNAEKGAEKSCRKRRSRRGQRTGRVRSRGLQPRSHPSAHVRPNSTAGTLTDRKIRRLSGQMDYWKARVKRVELALGKLGKERFFVHSRSARFNAKTGEYFHPLVAHDRYLLLREIYRSIQRRMLRTTLWVRPLREKWVGFLDSRFRFQPPGMAPSWTQLVGPPGMLAEFLEVCSEVGMRPNFKSWESFSSNDFSRISRASARTRGTNHRRSSESTSGQSRLARRRTDVAPVKFCHRCRRMTSRSSRGFCLICSRSL
jgi:hypothetical protein